MLAFVLICLLASLGENRILPLGRKKQSPNSTKWFEILTFGGTGGRGGGLGLESRGIVLGSIGGCHREEKKKEREGEGEVR